MKPVPISVSAEDSEILDSRKFTAEEVARLYGVPPLSSASGIIPAALSDDRSRPTVVVRICRSNVGPMPHTCGSQYALGSAVCGEKPVVRRYRTAQQPP